jgi:hypothetical protein
MALSILCSLKKVVKGTVMLTPVLLLRLVAGNPAA